MEKRKIVFLSLPSGIFGNGGQSWRSIDLVPAEQLLKNRGFEVIRSTIDKTQELAVKPSDIVIYSSCEQPDIREYMKDAFYFLRERCVLLPEYEFLLSYENKGFQELMKSKLGIGNLPGSYHFDLNDIVDSVPCVFKTTTGAGSSGVHLVRSDKDIVRMRRKYFGIRLKRKLIVRQRMIALGKDEYQAYKYRHKGFCRYIAQEFVPNAEYDYKVLIFGDRYFGLKRYVRKGDFRASGSGDFDFTSRLPDQVLNFAANLAERLGAPQLSLDIVTSIKGCHLIEYQAMNFGPMALTQSLGYYRRAPDTDCWSWTETSSDLSECFAYSLIHYFDKHRISST